MNASSTIVRISKDAKSNMIICSILMKMITTDRFIHLIECPGMPQVMGAAGRVTFVYGAARRFGFVTHRTLLLIHMILNGLGHSGHHCIGELSRQAYTYLPY